MRRNNNINRLSIGLMISGLTVIVGGGYIKSPPTILFGIVVMMIGIVIDIKE